MRDSISTNLSFSKEDREEHNLRVARLAQVLNKQGYNVIISVIAPFEEVRKKVNRVINPIWIYVKKNNDFGKDRPYEPPEKPDVLVNTDIQSVEECIETIVNSVVWQNFKK